MGVYSSNRTQLGAYNSDEIVANENYFGELGAVQMVIEGYQNDQALFEHVIDQDFAEATAVNEGTEVAVVTEASVGGFIDKMKELVRKAWEKIKGLFQTFMTKVNNVIIRDNKVFVDKYKNKVLSNTGLSKMKYKWAQPKGSAKAEKLVAGAANEIDGALIDCLSNGADALAKQVQAVDNGDLLEAVLSKATDSSTDSKSFSKDFHESLFGDSEEVEGLDNSRITYCMDVLINSKKSLEGLEKSKKGMDKLFADTLKNIDKARNTVLKAVPGNDSVNIDVNGKGGKTTTELAMKKLNTATKVIGVMNNGMAKIASAIITEAKFEISQARRVFAQAATFNGKAIKENALLVEAVGEAAEYELESSFNDYEM
ncbi:MAG: hypothetical protein ACRDD7_01200 [Peptostreptococcaceae bacterium]